MEVRRVTLFVDAGKKQRPDFCVEQPSMNRDAIHAQTALQAVSSFNRKIIVDTNFKGYTHHASRETPQYLIEGDKTDHIAIHKGSALQLIPSRARKSNKAKAKKRKE
jgi:Hypervirulence associated proteins TUDOR domain